MFFKRKKPKRTSFLGSKKQKRQKQDEHRRLFMINRPKTPTKGKRMRKTFLRGFENIKKLWFYSRKIRIAAIFVLILVCMAIFSAIALFSPYFTLKRIKVIRDSAHFDIEKVENVLKPFKGKNLLFLRDADIRDTLFQKFPQFESVAVTELWPDTLELKIELSAPVLTFTNDFNQVRRPVSAKGVLLAPKEGLTVPDFIIKQLERPIKQGEVILPPEDVQLFLELDQYSRQYLPFVVDKYEYLYAAKEIHVIAKDKAILWFDINQSLEEAFNKLLSAESELELEAKTFQHIDLRIPGHIFWAN